MVRKQIFVRIMSVGLFLNVILFIENISIFQGYTAVDYLTLYDENMSPDDRRRYTRLKDLLLVSMRSKQFLFGFYGSSSTYFSFLEDEPTYCTQKVVRSDFGNDSDEDET